MKLAHIAPTSVLKSEPFKTLDFHLALASQVLKDEVYAEYFRTAQGYVILDVPTYEDKDTTGPYSIHKLIKAIECIQPDEVVLPDIWQGAVEANIKVAYEVSVCLTEMCGVAGTFKLMAVPRGQTWEECIYCATEMSEMPGVTTLGILDSTYEKFGTHRLQAVLELSARFPSLALHLLGVQKTFEDIQNKELRSHVRSADTAKLVRFGLDCKHPVYHNIPDYAGRGEKYFEQQVSEIQLSFIAKNIRYWNNLVR